METSNCFVFPRESAIVCDPGEKPWNESDPRVQHRTLCDHYVQHRTVWDHWVQYRTVCDQLVQHIYIELYAIIGCSIGLYAIIGCSIVLIAIIDCSLWLYESSMNQGGWIRAWRVCDPRGNFWIVWEYWVQHKVK